MQGFFRVRRGLEALGEPYRGLVAGLLRGLLRVFGSRLVSLVVFGSVARGDAGPDSDVDLIVVVEGLPKSRFRRQELFEEAEREVEDVVEGLRREGFNVDFTPILLAPEEAERHRPLYLDVLVDGVIVYDRGGFMERVLRELADRLRALGARRVRFGRKWYWVLKEEYRAGEVIEA